MEDDSPSPGDLAASLTGALPGEGGSTDQPQEIPNLQNYSPVLLPIPMSNSASGTYSNYSSASAYTGLPASTPAATTSSSGNNALDTGLLNFAETAGSGLLNAFVINPKNVQTQQAAATGQFQLTSATISQLFSYLLIGLVIFLVFSVFTSHRR